MTFADLIKSNAWLSVKMVLVNLYPDQEEFMVEYERVFDQLQTLPPVASDIAIDLVLVHDSDDDTNYVDVSGHYTNTANGNDNDSNILGIEYTPWNSWLGMAIDQNSLKKYSEIEIIAHCLYEMTYAGFDQEGIQSELANLKSLAEKYQNLTPEELNRQSVSLDDLIAKFDVDSDKNSENSDADQATKKDDIAGRPTWN